MIGIDWNQLELNSNNSKEISFERFCFHFATVMLKGYGEITYPYNATGSEFYLELSKPWEYGGKQYESGDVIGWQAKFWVNHNDLENSSLKKANRNELKEGFEKTIEIHPKLALWIVCTPGQFQEEAYHKLKAELASVKDTVEITHWHKAVFESALVGEERLQYQGVFAFYFCKQSIEKKTLDLLTHETINQLEQKFDTDLHSASSFENQLMGIIDKEKAQEMVVRKLIDLKDRVESFEQRWFNDDGNRKPIVSDDLNDTIISALLDYENCILEIAKHLSSLLQEKDVDILSEKGLDFVASRRQAFMDCVARMEEATKGIRKGTAEAYSLDYYAEDIIDVKTMIFGNQHRRDESIVHSLNQRRSHYFPVFAQAGYGKTHFACSIASKQLSSGLPVLLLTGGQFCKCSRPQNVFLDKLGVDGVLSFAELLQALDILASFYPSCRLPIIIDGLNESFPNESVWREDLPTIIKGIEDSDHLILITTCREKTEYIQKIYKKHSYVEVDNSSLLTGIEDFNLLNTIHKYFDKYHITETSLVSKKTFRNPLLLKIFCEVNKGAKGITVNEYSLAESMKRYSDSLVDKLSNKDGAIDRILRHELKEGLLKMGEILWERNTRTVDFYKDFYCIFGDVTEALLEEGLCFQVETINEDGGDVKFTYDLLAGYHIASYLVLSTQSVEKLTEVLTEPKTHSLLYGDNDSLHTLSEDINRALIFLVRERYQLSLFEIVGDDRSLSKILNGLDMICASDVERKALSLRLSAPLSVDVKKAVCEHVRGKFCDYNSVTGISALLPAFQQFSRFEFDALFHCGFLAYSVLHEAMICVKKYLTDPLFKEDALIAATLLAGCFDYEQRQEIIMRLVFFARENWKLFASAVPTLLALNDPYIRESIYIIVHGAVVGSKDKELVKSAVRLLTQDLQFAPSSHIIMLDCADSLFDYAHTVFWLDVDNAVLLLSKNDRWNTVKDEKIWKSGVYDYDFEKYHIRPYSVLGFNDTSEYTSDELSNMILWRMTQCGYDDNAYSSLVADYVDKHRFYQRSVGRIPFKHVETAQRELVGWLLLNGYVKPEYRETLRLSEVDIDPGFPRLNPRRQLISESYLPKSKDNKKQWLSDNPLPIIKEYLQRKLPRHEGDWTLLYGRLSQKSDEKEAEVFWRVVGGLAHANSRDKVVELPAKDHSHLFASEIGWRKMVPTEDDYYDPSLGVFLLQRYEFSGWSETRPSLANFYFLSDQIQIDFGLVFHVSELKYYRDGNQVSEYYQDSTSEFFFIRKNLLEEIQNRYNVVLVREVHAEKIDKHMEEGSYRWNAFKEFKDIVIG